MNKNTGGFTLIELILVMVIIGILAGAVTLSLSGRVSDANKARVQSDLKVYQTAIDLFMLDNNDKLPRDLRQLTKAGNGRRDYVREYVKDPWGRDYIFKAPGKNGMQYDLFSVGDDGQAGTADDISVWTTQNVAQDGQ